MRCVWPLTLQRDALLLCAGVELDSSFAPLCAKQNVTGRGVPTFSLALAALPDPHWSAITPAGPLRHWRLIEVGVGEALTTSPLRIDERVLHYLAGVSYLDDRLQGSTGASSRAHNSCRHHTAHYPNVSRSFGHPQSPRPCQSSISAAMKQQRNAHWRRTRALNWGCSSSCWTRPTCRVLRLSEKPWRAYGNAKQSSVEAHCFLIATMRKSRSAALHSCNRLAVVYSSQAVSLLVRIRRPTVRMEIRKLGTAEQVSLWHQVLGPRASRLNGELERLVSQFALGAEEIGTAECPGIGDDGRRAGSRYLNLLEHLPHQRARSYG